MCRPTIIPDVDHLGVYLTKPFLDLRNMTHPGVKLKNMKTTNGIKKKFVPNNTIIATPE